MILVSVGLKSLGGLPWTSRGRRAAKARALQMSSEAANPAESAARNPDNGSWCLEHLEQHPELDAIGWA